MPRGEVLQGRRVGPMAVKAAGEQDADGAASKSHARRLAGHAALEDTDGLRV